MLVIRLSPTGKKGQKFFRLIVSEKTKDVFGDYLELLGNYNPHTEPATTQLKTDRIKYWISKGAQCSPTVNNLLVDQKIIEGKKVTSWKPKKKEGAETPATDAPKPAAPAAPAPTPETPPVAEAPQPVTEAPKPVTEPASETPKPADEPAKPETPAAPATEQTEATPDSPQEKPAA